MHLLPHFIIIFLFPRFYESYRADNFSRSVLSIVILTHVYIFFCLEVKCPVVPRTQMFCVCRCLLSYLMAYQVHPRATIQEQDELSSLLQVPLVVRFPLSRMFITAAHRILRCCLLSPALHNFCFVCFSCGCRRAL